MEWIQTTGKTVEQAKERALDQLGIAADEAEFETVASPKKGLFGMVRGEAQVRARVRPVQPRSKDESRRGRGGDRQNKRGGGNGAGRSGERGKNRSKGSGGGGRQGGSGQKGRRDSVDTGATRSSAKPTPTKQTPARSGGGDRPPVKKDQETPVNMSIEEQSEVVEDFLGGLVDAFGLTADIGTTKIEEDTVLVRVDGEDLGLLVGRKGRTLSAIHEISRAVLHREADGPLRGRIRLDVAGYRERRQAALEAFVRETATKVIEDGVDLALEPMSAPDRKIVHDTAGEIDGIRTLSEGEEPNRRVVLVPESDD